MIEIIKEGTKNRMECDNCGALMGYTTEDIEKEEKYIGTRSSYTEKYITCPQCHNKIVFSTNK